MHAQQNKCNMDIVYITIVTLEMFYKEESML